MAVALAVVLGFTATSRAAVIYEVVDVPLSSLVGGQTVQVGDKVFGDFSVSSLFADNGALLPSPTVITVSLGQDQNTSDYVMRLNILQLSVGSGQSANANISFSVSIAPEYPDWYLEDVGLVLTGGSATGNGVVNIGETVWDRSPTETGAVQLAALSTSYDKNFAQLSDHGYFTPVKQIWVTKDISVAGGVAGGAHVSQIIETFSQVPEPATLSLLGAGLLLAVRRRRR